MAAARYGVGFPAQAADPREGGREGLPPPPRRRAATGGGPCRSVCLGRGNGGGGGGGLWRSPGQVELGRGALSAAGFVAKLSRGGGGGRGWETLIRCILTR